MTELSELKAINVKLAEIIALLKYPLTGSIDENIVAFYKEEKE